MFPWERSEDPGAVSIRHGPHKWRAGAATRRTGAAVLPTGAASYRTGVSRRSWKSKLKSVDGDTAFIEARSIVPSGVRANVT